MTRPPLRLARPGQLPGPVTSDDSLQIFEEAIERLARLRTPYWLGDSGVRLHALASLIAQAEQLLPQAVHNARDQETHLDRDRRAPRHHRRHGGAPLPRKAMIHLTRITGIMLRTGFSRLS